MRETKLLFAVFLTAFVLPAFARQEVGDVSVKNLIIMIPDGTSLPVVSASRWVQWYRDSKVDLYIDPYLCGTVSTFSSNAPIGDSAPTTSCYMTGYPSRAGFVSTYPSADSDNDIYPVDTSRSYQPLATLFEAARLCMNKSIGLVFTCEFPHATPADCAAHSYDRSAYQRIAPQMIHNDLSVVMGGGLSYLLPEGEHYLMSNGYSLYKKDLHGVRTDTSARMWALFAPKAMDYDIDRDTSIQPSLQEMTRIAIDKLSRNPNGFLLMVEGSKIDWAAHANDPVGIVSDFLAFDRACGEAIDFAKRDGQTAVVIVPDHGNSGFSVGRRDCKGYDKLTKHQLFETFSQFRLTAEGLAHKIVGRSENEIRDIVREYTGIVLSPEELVAICSTSHPTPVIAGLFTSRTCFGFTTGGHTGEEVFLAAYHPQGYLPLGRRTNVELNQYLSHILALPSLDEVTERIFAPHPEVFPDCTYKIESHMETDDAPVLMVKKGKKTLTISPFTNAVKLGKKIIRLNSVVVYVDKTNTFYLPRNLRNYLD
ncbi:MAG: alkaline phosphatase [Tannerellaceae bacterium]|jgi:alkaline phosphatase|nr:alkaline phosphatase [Tannerellaceae bacterium]